MKIILLGPPGAGKGTQAEILSTKLNLNTISTGVMLRTAIREKTNLGEIAAKYINDGKLVPDDVVVGIVKERLTQPDCENGFILDGFPRTTQQAVALSESDIKIDKVLLLDVPDDVIVERLSGRRECKQCGTPYHIKFNPSAKGDICEKCGGELICRKDDNVDTVKNRIKIYHEKTEPIKAFYEKQGILVVAYGQDKLENTTKEVFSALGIEEN